MKKSYLRSLIFCVVFACLLPSAFAADPNPPSIHSNRGAWKISRQWTPAETGHYARWVEHLFKMKLDGNVEQRMAKLERMITDPEMNLLEDPAFRGEGCNPQLPRDLLRDMHNVVDCAKLTAFLPAYYAYRRGLPWMSAYVRPEKGGDVRQSENNIPSGSESNFTSPSVRSFFHNAIYGFSSGNYRVELDGPGAHLSDTVPVAIDRKYLKPGTVNYTDGHCLLLAQVTEYGELRFINASTTKTRDIFTFNGMNTVSGITPAGLDPEDEWQGCFQGLRVFRYPIAITDRAGKVTDVRRRTNEEMREFGFSTEQYEFSREMRKHQYIDLGSIRPQSLHDLIRLRMKTTDRISPLAFMEEYADEILEVYEQRVEFVDDAWADYKANGPVVFPEEQPNENIFQAYGRWETWSSPSSDVDRRNKYFYLGDWLDFAIRSFAIMPEFVDLTGFEQYRIQTKADLARAFVAEKNRIFAERSLTYTKSNGEAVRLTLADIEQRLYDLSFDPNHPPELRWGAPEGSEERASMPQTYTPVPDGTRIPMEEAYRLQTYYRSVGQREVDTSPLRGMFTRGYPIRDKLDGQLAKWFGANPADGNQTWLAPNGQSQRQAESDHSRNPFVSGVVSRVDSRQ